MSSTIIYIAIMIKPGLNDEIIKPSDNLEKLTKYLKKEFPHLYFCFNKKESQNKQNKHILIQNYG